MNDRAMVAASEQVQRSASRRAVIAGCLVLVGILSFGLLSRALRRDILDRLDELRSVAAAIAGGDHRRRAACVRDDELGMVAGQLNALLDLQQETENNIQSRLLEVRLALRGLVATWSEPVALFLVSGELVASSLDGSDTTLAMLAAASPSLPRGDGPADEVVEREEGGRRYRYRLIRAPEGQRVGWLATRAVK
jgi:methyl-accepting chemotaxis protein